MRAGIGLVALLLGVGLMVYIFAQSEIPKIKAGEAAKKEVRQYAGYGQDSAPATESFTATAEMRGGGRIKSLTVTTVTPGGAMDTFYNLQPGDEIIEIAGMTLDALSNDEETARILVASEGYQKKQPLTVIRAGQKMTLPVSATPPGPAAAPQAATSTPAPVTPAPAPAKPRGLEGQLQGIQDAAGGGDQ